MAEQHDDQPIEGRVFIGDVEVPVADEIPACDIERLRDSFPAFVDAVRDEPLQDYQRRLLDVFKDMPVDIRTDSPPCVILACDEGAGPDRSAYLVHDVKHDRPVLIVGYGYPDTHFLTSALLLERLHRHNSEQFRNGFVLPRRHDVEFIPPLRIPPREESKDMEFSDWMAHLLKTTCAAMAIPAEEMIQLSRLADSTPPRTRALKRITIAGRTALVLKGGRRG